jgi:TonB family protein
MIAMTIHLVIALIFIFWDRNKDNYGPIPKNALVTHSKSRTEIFFDLNHQVLFPKNSAKNSEKKLQVATKKNVKPAPSESSISSTNKESNNNSNTISNAPTSSGPISDEEYDPDAIHIDNEHPIYPPIARLKKIEGKVKLKIIFQESGVVKKVDVIESSHFDILDQAAIDAAKKWIMPKGPEEISLEKIIEFKLNP